MMLICKASRLGVRFVLLVFCCCVGCGGPMAQWKASDMFTDEDVIALAEAAEEGDLAEIDRLVAKGVDVNTMGKDDMTPLTWSLFAKNKEAFERLLEHGANPNAICKDRHSVMEFASLHEDPEYLRIVLAHGGDPSLVHPRLKRTPLFFAIQSRHKENLDLLIEAEANLNHKDEIHRTPMTYAAGMHWFDSVYYLLEAGADYTIEDSDGYRLVHDVVEMTPDQGTDGYRFKLKVIAFLKKEGVDFAPIEAWAKKHADKAEQHRKRVKQRLGL